MRRPKTIGPARANAGVRAAYQRRLDALIGKMQSSVEHWVTRAYRANAPAIAQDAAPAADLAKVMRALRRRWTKQFNQVAPDLAGWFATTVDKRSGHALRAALKRGGMTVEFRPTPAQRDVLKATIEQNVSLIKSIPQQYFTEVEGIVMRSVQTGRDLGALTRQIEARYGVTRRRAALIARDQNNKATSAMTRARQQEIGITQAIWRHSHAGKEPRPKHVAADGTKYDVRKGLKIGDKGQWVLPGEEINCRCYSVSIVPGF